MSPETIALIIPAFIAGIITFLAPCTLPLVPAYLGFISGTAASDLKDPEKAPGARRRIFLNGLFFMVGVTVVFVVFGTLAGLLGQALAPWRIWLTRIGGAFVIMFGLYMTGILKIGIFNSVFGVDRRIKLPFKVKKGNQLSSATLGASFAFGWTPCVGPILAVILTFAASSATVGTGTLLLIVFSAGLAIPFLLVALGIGWALKHLAKASRYLNWVSIVGGLFLILMGIFMVTDNFTLWIAVTYKALEFINYDALLDYL